MITSKENIWTKSKQRNILFRRKSFKVTDILTRRAWKDFGCRALCRSDRINVSSCLKCSDKFTAANKFCAIGKNLCFRIKHNFIGHANPGILVIWVDYHGIFYPLLVHSLLNTQDLGKDQWPHSILRPIHIQTFPILQIIQNLYW